MMRFLPVGLAAVVCFAQQPQEDLRSLVRHSLAFLHREAAADQDYACRYRLERTQFDSSGKVIRSESIAGERIEIGGVLVSRPTERNGRKLTDEELRKSDDILHTRVAELRSLPDEEREQRRRKAAKEQEWLKEIADALDFASLGEEILNGRPAMVVGCSPRPGYSARNMRARVFEKTRGKLWIDRADRELVKADAEVFDTVRIGFGILGAIEKGGRFHIARMRLPDGAWVMQRRHFRFGARVMLVKWIGNEIDVRFHDYRHKSQLVQR